MRVRVSPSAPFFLFNAKEWQVSTKKEKIMKVTELKSEGLKREYKVSIPAADVAAKVDEKLAQVAKSVKLPGFRPGKAPLSMIKQKYQASVMGDVLDDMVRTGSEKVIADKKLHPSMMPSIKINSFGEGKDIEFEMNMEVLPEIKLGDITKLSIEKPMAEVPTEEIDKALGYLAKSRHETVKIEEDRAAQKGDVAVIDFVGSVDGVEFKGGKGEGYSLELGSGTFIPGFEDQLVGKKAGEKVDVNVTFPENYHAKDLAGKAAVFAVEVKELRKNKEVKIDDEFAKSLGEKSLDDLKQKISDRIKVDYEGAARLKMKRQILDALDKEYSFEVPENLVDAEYKGILAQYEQAKKYNQLDESEKAKSEDELKQEYKDIAVRRVKLGLVLSEIGKDAKINIEADDINKAIMNEARKYPGQEQIVLDYYLKNKQAVEALKAPIFEEKIIDHIVSKANVANKTVSVEELYSFDEEEKPAKKAAKKAVKAESSEEEKSSKKTTKKSA